MATNGNQPHRSLSPWPFQWLPPIIAHHFDALHIPHRSSDLQLLVWAAKLRLAARADVIGALPLAPRAQLLRTLWDSSSAVCTMATWYHWFQDSFMLHLDAAVRKAAEAGVTLQAIQEHILRHPGAPATPQQARAFRARFQATARTMLQPRPRPGSDTPCAPV